MKAWIRGLLFSIMSGAGSAIASGLTVASVDPQHFNLEGGLGKVLTVLLMSALIGGLSHAGGYLHNLALKVDAEDVASLDGQGPN